MWVPQRLTTLWASTACYRDTFTYLVIYCQFKGHTERAVRVNALHLYLDGAQFESRPGLPEFFNFPQSLKEVDVRVPGTSIILSSSSFIRPSTVSTPKASSNSPQKQETKDTSTKKILDTLV
jgi:hypothetical protein